MEPTCSRHTATDVRLVKHQCPSEQRVLACILRDHEKEFGATLKKVREIEKKKCPRELREAASTAFTCQISHAQGTRRPKHDVENPRRSTPHSPHPFRLFLSTYPLSTLPLCHIAIPILYRNPGPNAQSHKSHPAYKDLLAPVHQTSRAC